MKRQHGMVFNLGTETPHVLGEVTLTVWCWDDGNWGGRGGAVGFGVMLCDPGSPLALRLLKANARLGHSTEHLGVLSKVVSVKNGFRGRRGKKDYLDFKQSKSSKIPLFK